jgi:predicted PhzF superfamily epimerase YddE/YHI9
MPNIPFRSLALAAIIGAAAPEIAIAQQQTQSGYSDSELQAYAKARAEIQPIQLAEISAPNDAERARDEAQINAALARNGLTREDYDSIATVAMADTGVSARIAQLADASETPLGA